MNNSELVSLGGQVPEGLCGYVDETEKRCGAPAAYDIFYEDPLGQQHYGIACVVHGAQVRGDAGLISIQSR